MRTVGEGGLGECKAVVAFREGCDDVTRGSSGMQCDAALHMASTQANERRVTSTT